MHSEIKYPFFDKRDSASKLGKINYLDVYCTPNIENPAGHIIGHFKQTELKKVSVLGGVLTVSSWITTFWIPPGVNIGHKVINQRKQMLNDFKAKSQWWKRFS